MADLENMLLEAAGRTGSSARRNQSRSQQKWRRDDPFSENSDSNDSDDGRYTKRKPPGLQVPLKKRFDPPEREARGGWVDDDDDDDPGSGDDSDSFSIGSDLYKDDEDREALQKLPEFQREMILTERSMKRDDYRLKKKARQTVGLSRTEQKPRRESPPPLPSRNRSSARSDRTTAAKSDALNELRAKRMKQQDSEGYRRLRDTLGSGASLRTREDSPPKHKAISMPLSPGSDSGENESGGQSDGEEERYPSNMKLVDNVDDEPSSLKPLNFEDVKEITIRRRKLAKWLMEPFFEEIIVGCFVRLGIGTTRSGRARYRLCMVRNVDASDPDRQYKFEGYTTHKYLNCVWGSESSAARWQMAMISDSEPTLEEFNDWILEVERTGGRMPIRQEVSEKKEAIQKINTFVYSAATVKQMLQEKKSASSRPINVAAEKDRLRKEMVVAENRRDEAEVERIRARLKELEQMSRLTKQIDAKAVRLAEMNRKNRAENFKNASELKPVNTSLKAGEAGYDPFSRRWTRSMNYYVSKPGGEENGAAANGDAGGIAVANGAVNGLTSANGVEVAGVAATVAALEAAAGAGKLVDTNAPVDQGTESNSLHNFELPISLTALQMFGGPQGAHFGFMARKQRIEAMIGYKVPDNDGRRHALTLTISDYKRRRGLL